MKARDCFLSLLSTCLKEPRRCGDVSVNRNPFQRYASSCSGEWGPACANWHRMVIGIIQNGLKQEACLDAGVLFQQALFRHLSIKCHKRLKGDWIFSQTVEPGFGSVAFPHHPRSSDFYFRVCVFDSSSPLSADLNHCSSL